MTPPRLIQCEQNTPEWHAARLGYITASGVADLMTHAKSGKGMGKPAHAYVNKLARARIFGVPDREKPNRNFDRGHALEPIARAAYEELEFGGDWVTARKNLKEALLDTNHKLKQHWPKELGPMYFGDPFEQLASLECLELGKEK